MRYPIIRVRDKLTGHVHIVGTDTHDTLYVGDDGGIHYYNLQNGEGTGRNGDYEFVGVDDEYALGPEIEFVLVDQTEVQRLREALDRIRRYEMMTKMKKTPVWKIADEALQAGERETDENLVGRTVKWTSQSQGVVKEKSGMVVAIVEPKEDLMPYLPPGLPSSRLKADRYSMSRRALVAVPRTSGNGCDYYAPPVKWLQSTGGEVEVPLKRFASLAVEEVE